MLQRQGCTNCAKGKLPKSEASSIIATVSYKCRMRRPLHKFEHIFEKITAIWSELVSKYDQAFPCIFVYLFSIYLQNITIILIKYDQFKYWIVLLGIGALVGGGVCPGGKMGVTAGRGVGLTPTPVKTPVTPETMMGCADGFTVAPSTPGIGIHWGTLQHWGSLGSAVSVHVLGRVGNLAHLLVQKSCTYT